MNIGKWLLPVWVITACAMPPSLAASDAPEPETATTQVVKPKPEKDKPPRVKKRGERKKAAAEPQKPTAAKTTQFPGLDAPPSPIPASKQAQLDELLRKYKADQLTPEEYHRERARILAEP